MLRNTPSAVRRVLALAAVSATALAGCGDDGSSASAGEDAPTIVVTTSILGDVVANLVGDQAEVTTIMPVGADPHDFQASAQQAAQMRDADALVVNGAGFEEGLLDVIDGAADDGVPTHEAIRGVEPVAAAKAHGHPDAEHDDEPGHDDEAQDPHFFGDPTRMAVAVEGIARFLADHVEGLDRNRLEEATDAYIEQLRDLDAEIEALLDGVRHRVLVTNHEVFAYFAERYDFEVVGVVVPGGSASDTVSARDLAQLAEVIREEGVPAIFADASAGTDIAEALASDVGDVAVIELFSESLGGPGSDGETYIAMQRSNAERIAAALG